MKIGVFYYQGFTEFEFILCAFYFREQELISFSLSEKVVESFEHQKFCVDKTIADIDPSSFDLIIVPGGDSTKYYENEQLKSFFNKALLSKCKLAAICGGSELIASLGLLKGKKCTGDSIGISEQSNSYKYFSEAQIVNDNVVIDGSIITGQGQAFIQFSVEVARIMGIIKSDEEILKEMQWFMNIRNINEET